MHFLFLSLLALVSSGLTDWGEDFRKNYIPLWEVYGEIDAATAERNRAARLAQWFPTLVSTTTTYRRTISPSLQTETRGHLLRNRGVEYSRDLDVFCSNRTVDILILQDATGSLQEIIDVTVERTLSEIEHHITPNFDVVYSVVSFRDKPIHDLGETDDDCYTPGLFKQSTAEALKPFFEELDAGGGRDYPENQYGALQAVIQSPNTIPWTRSENSAKLVLVVTDAVPHYEGDSSQRRHPTLKPFGSTYNGNKSDEFCSERYYPSPTNIKGAILDQKVYVAVIIPDTHLYYSEAQKAWRWFMKYVGFPEHYVKPMGDGKFDWSHILRKLIDDIYAEKCPSETSTSKPTTHRPKYCPKKHH